MSAAVLTVADILQKLMASFAFLVGGFWVLMNYVRNRTHVPRLQVEMSTELIRRGTGNTFSRLANRKMSGCRSFGYRLRKREEKVPEEVRSSSERSLIFRRKVT